MRCRTAAAVNKRGPHHLVVTNESSRASKIMSRFANKVALVTGAASGIGAAVTQQLIDDDATVVLFDLNAAAVESAATALGDKALAHAGDVTNEDDVKAAVDAAVAKFGKPTAPSTSPAWRRSARSLTARSRTGMRRCPWSWRHLSRDAVLRACHARRRQRRGDRQRLLAQRPRPRTAAVRMPRRRPASRPSQRTRHVHLSRSSAATCAHSHRM